MRYVRDRGDTTLPFLGSPLPPRWPEMGATRNQFATIEYRRIDFTDAGEPVALQLHADP